MNKIMTKENAQNAAEMRMEAILGLMKTVQNELHESEMKIKLGEANWGDVGSLAHVEELLAEVAFTMTNDEKIAEKYDF